MVIMMMIVYIVLVLDMCYYFYNLMIRIWYFMKLNKIQSLENWDF